MNFDKTNLNSNAIKPQNSGSKKKETSKKKEEVSKEVPKEAKKTPNDPKYWQSVAFRGSYSNSENGNEGGTKAFIEDAMKDLAYPYSSYFCVEEKRDYYRKMLEDKEHLGKEALERCLKLIQTSLSLHDSQRSEWHDEMTNLYFENYDRLKDIDFETMESLIRHLSSYFRDSEPAPRMELFKNVICESETSPKEKVRWLFYDNRRDTRVAGSKVTAFDKSLEDIDRESAAVTKFLSFAKDDDEAQSLKRISLSDDLLQKATALFVTDTVSPEQLIRLHRGIEVYRRDDDEFFELLITDLYSALEQQDSSLGEYLNNLQSKNLIESGIQLKELSDFIHENDPFKKEAVKTFIEMGEKRNRAYFPNLQFFETTMSLLNPENFNDYIECLEETRANSSFSGYFESDYKNPVTGFFDREIYEADKKYTEALEASGRKTTLWGDKRSSNIFRAAIDSKTGKLSPVALDFIEKYFVEGPNAQKSDKKAGLKFISGFHSNKDALYKHVDEFRGSLADIIESMKDNTGSFNPKNVKYMSKIMEASTWHGSYNFSFFNNLKDENGVVDKVKFNFAMQVLDKTKDMNVVAKATETLTELGPDETRNAFLAAEQVLGSEKAALTGFSVFVKNCWGDDIEKIQNGIFVRDLADLLGRPPIISDTLFEVVKNEDNKEFLLSYAGDNEGAVYNVNELVSALFDFLKEDGSVDDFVKEKIRAYVDTKASPYYFKALFNACVTDKENPKNGFLENEFKKVSSIYVKNPSLSREIEPEILVEITKGTFKPGTLKFKDKVSLLNVFEKLQKTPEESGFEPEFVNEMIDELDKSIRNDSIFLPIDEESRITFNSEILGTSNVDKAGYTNFENVLKNSIPLLEKMEGGVSLTYSPEKFIEELNKLCDSEEKIKILKEKTGIIPVYDENRDEPKIKGYEGIILLDKLNKEEPFERDLYNLMHGFMYENYVQTGNIDLDNELNKVIKACPEFINIIGKKQHSTHNYTLDIHSLLVLANSINNPEYLKLNPTDKAMLKISCLFHDIAKQQETVDDGHQEPSSVYARSIVKKFFDNEDSKDRVYELVRNHHWLKEYSTAPDKEKAAKEMAYKFRRPNDFEIAKIMARADLISVSETFYNQHKEALNEENLEPIGRMLEKFYGSGCALITDYPAQRPLQNHTETLNGREFQVVNFHNIKDGEDLSDYGFEAGKTKDDIVFLVHMVNEGNMEEGLRKVDLLTSPMNGGVLSESIISPKYNRTYTNRKYGVVLSQISANVVNINKTNQGSGFEKDFNNIMELAFSDGITSARQNFKKGFLSNLGIEPTSVSNKEFAEFYKNHIVLKTSYTQFYDDKEYKIGDRTVTGKEIKKAIKDFQASIIDKKQEEHNEIVGYIPKIKAVVAKEKSLSDVPVELLNFAHENNLPVVLI